ncbi:MAG: IS21 family transposase [Rhodospirillales bacterium]|nr:IS21 family transposase [Rhodospirillales bacterium]
MPVLVAARLHANKPVKKPKLGALLPVIDAILEADRTAPSKQRHSAKRIFERLRDEHGYAGGVTVVRDYVRVARAKGRETFVPLAHPPGHAQVDFGEAIGVIGGVRQKIHFFCMDVPQSDAPFVKAYPAETTEAFLDGHVSAFAFFGGVPLSVLYDNTTIAVAKICGDGRRGADPGLHRTRATTCSATVLAVPARATTRARSRAGEVCPIELRDADPQAASYDDLNVMLEERCRRRQGERAGRHSEPIGERLVADLESFRDLPAVPLEACEKRGGAGLVNRPGPLPLQRLLGADGIRLPGCCGEGLRRRGGDPVCRRADRPTSPRLRHRTFVFEPLHYLALIETKPNALDQAAALKDWDLPEAFQHLRHLLEARMGNRGRREFIQVLRLMEAIPMEIVASAVTEAIRLGAIGFDAVKQIALARIERRPARLDLTAYPHLPRTDVRMTTAADYAVLVPGTAA